MFQLQIYYVFILIIITVLIVGVLHIAVYLYPWWYINQKGREAGLDEFTISQWQWKALWIPWLALYQFQRYLKTLKRDDIKTAST